MVGGGWGGGECGQVGSWVEGLYGCGWWALCEVYARGARGLCRKLLVWGREEPGVAVACMLGDATSLVGDCKVMAAERLGLTQLTPCDWHLGLGASEVNRAVWAKFGSSWSLSKIKLSQKSQLRVGESSIGWFALSCLEGIWEVGIELWMIPVV